MCNEGKSTGGWRKGDLSLVERGDAVEDGGEADVSLFGRVLFTQGGI